MHKNNIVKKSLWLSALSIPVSMGCDFYTAHHVYDVLREVNGNFQGMSDFDVWFETAWMSTESLTGLSSLTKGAYFEQLVSNDTGGQLFEHFNHPDTDIVIDGVEMQIKATDSVNYINSVDDAIPVIATTEVAEKTGSIDGGYSNKELNNTVSLALGGSVVDGSDTAIDAIATGVGSLGVFAAISGATHAKSRFSSGTGVVEAISEGAAFAVVGMSRGLVDTGGMVYQTVTSKFSKLIGRFD